MPSTCHKRAVIIPKSTSPRAASIDTPRRRTAVPGRPCPAGCFVLLLAALLAASACEVSFQPQWPEGNVLAVALSNAPTHLDPRVGTDASSGRLAQLLYNGLVTKDPRGNLVPDLARSWEVLEEGRRWRFHLRQGVTFHDGRPFGAEDVVWTFGSIVDGTVTTAKAGAFRRVVALEAVDALTVDFVLEEPFGSFLVDLTPAQGIVPAGALPQELNEHPVGTGPFRFVSRTPETVTLERFPEHWAGAPYLDSLTLREIPDSTVRALELMKGTVQLVINDLPPDLVPRFRDHPAYRVAVDPSAVYAYLGLNLRDPVLSDVRVRKALAHGIDRHRLVETLWRGLGVMTETMLPPGLWARHEELEPYRHDPQRAKELLDAAGYPDPDGDGPAVRFTLEYKTSTSEEFVLQAQVIQQMLAGVGVGIEIRSMEFATFYRDVQRGAFQIFSLTRFGAIDPHIFALVLHSENVPPQGQNRGFYANPQFDRLLEEAARRTDPEQRRPLYLKVQEIFRDELPYISLYTRMTVAVMPAQLRGYENYPNGELFSLKGVYWDRPGFPGP